MGLRASLERARSSITIGMSAFGIDPRERIMALKAYDTRVHHHDAGSETIRQGIRRRASPPCGEMTTSSKRQAAEPRSVHR